MKGFRTDIMCGPWYFGQGDEHNAKHAGSVAEIKDGKFVTRRLASKSRIPIWRTFARWKRPRTSQIECLTQPFLVSGLCTGAVYVLAGVGLVVLYRASGVLNLAQGALGALCALIAWQIAEAGAPEWVGWIAGVASATALALVYGRVIAPRLAHSDPIVRAVATLGFALVVLGFWNSSGANGRAACGCRPTVTPSPSSGFVSPPRGLIAFGLVVAMTRGMIVFLNRSRLGLSMRALGQQPRDQRPARRAGAAGRCLGMGDLRRHRRSERHPARQHGAAAGDHPDLLVVPAVAAAIARPLRSSLTAVIGGLAIGVAEAMATPFPDVAAYRGGAVYFRRRRAAVVSAARPDAVTTSPDRRQRSSTYGVTRKRPVAICSCRSGGIAVAAIVAMLSRVASAYWLKTSTSVVIIALCKPERRGALRPARHGVAVPIRAVRRRRLGGVAPLARVPLPFEYRSSAGGVAPRYSVWYSGCRRCACAGLSRADHFDDRRRLPGRHKRHRLSRRRPGIIGKMLRRRAPLYGAAIR